MAENNWVTGTYRDPITPFITIVRGPTLYSRVPFSDDSWYPFSHNHGSAKLHPGRLTWTIIMEVWNIIFLSKWVICRFQPLIFQGVPQMKGNYYWRYTHFSRVTMIMGGCPGKPLGSGSFPKKTWRLEPAVLHNWSNLTWNVWFKATRRDGQHNTYINFP